MDAATLQTRIDAGYAKAASRIGYAYTLYRPSLTGAVLVPANLITTLNASFDQQTAAFLFQTPQAETKPLYKGLFDQTLVQAGDYLSGPQGVFAVLRLDPIVPPLMARCAHVVSFARAASAAVPSGGYIGFTAQSSTSANPVRAGVPVSITPTKERARSPSLPGSTRDLSLLNVLVSATAMPNGSILDADIITDESGLRYQVEAAYWGQTGYQLIALRVEV